MIINSNVVIITLMYLLLDIIYKIAPLHFIGAISPGLAFIFFINIAVARGRNIALSSLYGFVLSYALLAIFVLIGVMEILEKFKTVYIFVKILGIAYLYYTVFRIWVNAKNITQSDINQKPHINYKHAIRSGFIMGLSNIQVPINILSISMQYIDPSISIYIKLCCALYMSLVIYLWFYVLVIFCGHKKLRIFVMNHTKITERILAVLFGLFVVRMTYKSF